MTCNMGKTDRVIRTIIGVAIVAWGITAQSWWGLIGIVPLATAAIGYCGAYTPFKFSTLKGK
ncbi:MAG TPA: DUF2892 domain-containing protein [bacterium]|nr:DUF2892 domain-containing protein [bacterium]